MVEVSNLYDLDIYTLTGQYVGRVADVVLNIRLGTISKLQVQSLEPAKKQVGFREIFTKGLQFSPEDEGSVRNYKDELLTIDFDKVRAIGDIMLIDHRDIRKVRKNLPPESVTPQNPSNEIHPEHTPEE